MGSYIAKQPKKEFEKFIKDTEDKTLKCSIEGEL